MKRSTRHRNPWGGNFSRSPAPVKDRRIIPVDGGPLRKSAAREFKRAMAKLEKARGEWRRFEQEDRPSFGRWMALKFGALMTEFRENSRLIHEQQALIHEVELEMLWSGHHNPPRAYAAVMKRRENPEPGDDFEEPPHAEAGPRENRDAQGARGDEGDFDPFEETGADVPRERREQLFESFLRSVPGFNPKHLSQAEYARLFAEFETSMFGDRARSERAQVRHEEKPKASREELRLKEIYRVLVRRLHPDLRADGDATVSAIWHEVQEAYGARNLDRLETLLALTELQSGADGGRASLSQMREALKELMRALRVIQRSIRGAKRDPAWGFSQAGSHAAMEVRIRCELEENVSEQRWVLADLKKTLERWSRPRTTPAKPRAKRPRYESNIPEPVQTDLFGF
jgi:hypothetical protein